MENFNEDILKANLNELKKIGGVIKVNSTFLTETIVLDSSSSCLDGGIWSCNTDPNGVFESKYGSKLKRSNGNFPILKIGREVDPISGSVVKNLGFVGNIKGMDTRKITNFDNIKQNAGLVLDAVRTDQCEFSKLSFCGLAVGVCVTDNAEVDANIFEKINTDGCGIGFYFAPRASYYTKIYNNVCADTPYYGFYARGNATLHNLILSETTFVRNGGGFNDNDGLTHAAVFFDNVNKSEISRCLFDDSGTFWYYNENDTSNEDRKPSQIKIPSLVISGNENRIKYNTFLNSSAESIILNGNNNVLMNNVVDGNVIINGKNNVISNLIFTNKNAKLILKGDAINSTKIIGLLDNEIINEKNCE